MHACRYACSDACVHACVHACKNACESAFQALVGLVRTIYIHSVYTVIVAGIQLNSRSHTACICVGSARTIYKRHI